MPPRPSHLAKGLALVHSPHSHIESRLPFDGSNGSFAWTGGSLHALLSSHVFCAHRCLRSHTPGKTFNGETGDVACDHLRLWREDVALMASIGLKHYRFSISWSRVMSYDQSAGTMVANEQGLQWYRDLLELLREKGMAAYVTLYHWDLPQSLQERRTLRTGAAANQSGKRNRHVAT